MSFLKTIAFRTLLFTSGFGFGAYAYVVDSVANPLKNKLKSDTESLAEILKQSEDKTKINY
jgi:hypothetical protein